MFLHCNGSCFAYTSQENIINYILNLQYLNPDVVILYTGYPDIRAYFTKNFSYDFRHFRRSLSNGYEKIIAISSFLSCWGGYFIRSFCEKFLYTGNLKSDFIKMISTENQLDIDQDPSPGLKTFEQNIANLAHILKGQNTVLVISTYCHYLNEERVRSKEHRIFNKVLEKQNDILRNLSKVHNNTLVDNAILLEKTPDLFEDEVHFTIKGAEIVANNLFQAVINLQEIDL